MSLNAVNFKDFFHRRAIVMKSVPRFLRGPFQSVLRIALQEALSPDVARRERGWEVVVEFHTRREGGFDREGTALVQVGELSSARQGSRVGTPQQTHLVGFGKTLRSSKKGSGGGPSSMTNEHLRPGFSAGHSPLVLGEKSTLLWHATWLGSCQKQ